MKKKKEIRIEGNSRCRLFHYLDNIILISICLICFFIHTFTGEEFTHLLGKLFHRLMTLSNDRIFALILILLSAIQTHFFL